MPLKTNYIIMMEKSGRVEEGKTPSVISGRPSTKVRNGEAVCEGEKCANIETINEEKETPKED